jgi:complex III assembly factor LYRM7
MALAAYRALLRSTAIAFKGPSQTSTKGQADPPGDSRTLLAARQKVREGFESGRALACDGEEAAKQIQHAREVARFLRENVVQAEAMSKKADTFSKLVVARLSCADASQSCGSTNLPSWGIIVQ